MKNKKSYYSSEEPGTHYEVHLNWDSLMGILNSIHGCIEVWERLGGKKQDNIFLVLRVVASGEDVHISGLDDKQVVAADGIAVLGLGVDYSENSNLGVHERRDTKTNKYPNFFN